MSLAVDVICDGCGEIIGSAHYGNAAAARKDARDVGAVTGLPGGQDFCKQCKGKGQA